MTAEYRGVLRTVIGLIFTILFVVISSHFAVAGKSDLGQWTGKHTRLTWVQDQGEGADTFAQGVQLMLYGYDSKDGRGERPLIPGVGNYFKPLFTPDGQYVVVSNRKTRQMYLVEWDTGVVKELGSGVAVEVWREPKGRLFFRKPKVWVYFFFGSQAENKYGTSQPLYRFELNKPKKRELVWDKTKLAWSNMQMSRDGQMMAGLFPWPHGGVLRTKEQKWQKLGRGCWTSLSPDNSKLFWIFDGLHRNVQIYDVENGGSWKVAINGAPAVKGLEIYHPRWSNHPRYFVITGPYEKGEGGNRIGGGGEKVEVLVGRLDNQAKVVEDWLQVTKNNKADFYPDLWIEGGGQAQLADGVAELTASSVSALSWPASRNNLVFVWDNMKADNQLVENSPVGFYQCNVELRGNALYNRDLALLLSDGWGETGEAGEKIAAAVVRSQQMSIELLYKMTGKGNYTILSLSEKDNIGIRLERIGNDLQVVAQTDKGQAGQKARWKNIFVEGRPVHLVFTFDGKYVQLFEDGKGQKKIQFTFDFRQVASSSLVFGVKGGKGGAVVSNIAIYNSVIPNEDISENYRLVQEKLKKRSSVERIIVQARLVESTELPAPDSLGAYRRALVVNSYAVLKMIQGDYRQERIVVAEWAVLDRQVIKQYPAVEITETLVLEKFSDHPELEGERLMMDIFEPDLSMYYRLGSVPGY